MTQLSATIGVLATLAQTLVVPAARPRPVPLPNAALVRLAPAGPVTPTAVCGTVVVPVDSAVDRRMVRPAPSDAAYTMRAIKPPVCRD